MAETTNIAWAHATWSPWRGCAKVSPGCDHCYAEAMSHRNPAVLGKWGPNGNRTVNADWKKPLQWDRAAAKAGERRRVFPSLCDPFEDFWGKVVDTDGNEPLANSWYPPLGRGGGDRLILNHVRERWSGLIRSTPNLDWLLLTKRPENVVGMSEDHFFGIPIDGSPVIPRNVWLGTSVEDQQRADERIPHLLATPAAVRWLSVEPLLGPVDLTSWLVHDEFGRTGDRIQGDFEYRPISWVIVGGESGPNARPCDVAWIRSIVRQSREAGVPVFVKQLGANVVASNDAVADWFGSVGHLDMATTERFQGATGRIRGLRHPKGGDPMEWPEDLRVQEFPAVKGVVA